MAQCRAIHWGPSFSTKEEGLNGTFHGIRGPLPLTSTFNLAVYPPVLVYSHGMIIKTVSGDVLTRHVHWSVT